MAQVHPVTLKLQTQGFAGIKNIGQDFKKFSSTVSLTKPKIDKFIQGITAIHGNTKLSKVAFEGQISALARLRNNVGIGTVAYTKLGVELDKVRAKMNAATAAASSQGGIFARLNKQFKNIGVGSRAALGALAGTATAGLGSTGQLAFAGGAVGGAPGAVIGAGLGAAVDTVGFAKEASEYTASLDKAKIALRGIVGSQADFETALKAASIATEEFNVPQEVAIKGMQRLSAAVLGAGGNVNNAQEAFLNTVAAIKATGGTADDVKSALTAMVQIFSKGKVSAEELSGQLGERFPGAVTKFAQANNMTTQSLQESLKNGTVGLDMLSRFIESLGAEYIPIAREIAKSNAEAGARLVVATNKMRIAVGDNFKEIGAEFQILAAELITELAPAFGEVARVAVAALKVIVNGIKFLINSFDELIFAIKATAAAFITLKITSIIASFKSLSAIMLGVAAALGKVTGMLIAATAAQKGFNLAVLKNPYVILAVSIIAAIKLIDVYKARQKGLLDDANEGFANLSTKSTSTLKFDLSAAESNIKSLREKYDNIFSAQITMDDGGNVVTKSVAAQRVEILEEIKKEQDIVNQIRGVLGTLGKKTEFPSLQGANEKTEKLVNLNKDLNNAIKERNVMEQLILKRNIELEKLASKFEKKKKGKDDDKQLSEKDQIDFENQQEAIRLKFKKDSTLQVEKELSVRRNLLVELGLMRQKDAEREQIAQRARQIAKDNLEILDAQGISVDELTQKLTDAKVGTFNLKDSFEELIDSTTDLETNIGKLAVDVTDKLGNAFADFFTTGKMGFADLARTAIQELNRIIIKAAFMKFIANPILGALNLNANGNVISGGEVVPSAMGNVFAGNKIVPYAMGGIVSRPSIFPMANGMGLMSEAGPEAIMPLKRGANGKLGVQASGGVGNIVVNVDASGSSVEANEAQSAELGRMLGAVVQAELIKQKRPGGLLG